MSAKGGVIVIQINDEVNLIEELNWYLHESRLVPSTFKELKIVLIVVYHPPELTSRNFLS